MAGRGGRGGRSGGSRSSSSRSSGGSFRSHGSRHGGMYHRHHHHHRHHSYYRRRHGLSINLGTGKGAILGLLIFLPFIIIFFVMFAFFFGGPSGCGCSFNENTHVDEALVDKYTENQYNEKFASLSNYEDYALIVFLIDDEEYYEYYYCTWIGDHVSANTANLLGLNDSTLDDAFEANISTDYKKTISLDLASTIYQLISKSDSNGLTCNESTAAYISSHVDNDTNLNIDEATINAALKAFEDKTGVKLVLVIDTINEVCIVSSKEMTIDNLMPFIIIGVILLFFIIIIISNIFKGRRNSRLRAEQEKAENMVFSSNKKEEEEDPFKIDPNDY